MELTLVYELSFQMIKQIKKILMLGINDPDLNYNFKS
jgi:hypothetical protein